MNNINLDRLCQQDIWTYYLGYFKCDLFFQQTLKCDNLKPTALVYFTENYIPFNKDKMRVQEVAYERENLEFFAVGISVLEFKKVKSRLSYVLSKYNVLGLFNLTHSNIQGQVINNKPLESGLVIDIDRQELEEHLEEIQKVHRWTYCFYDGLKNLTPPVMHPKIPMHDTTILKAFCMCLPEEEAIKDRAHLGPGYLKSSYGTMEYQHFSQEDTEKSRSGIYLEPRKTDP
jgi:hypothetical protein